MNEIQIRAQIDSLIEQRNNALNAVVNLSGELAVAKARIVEIERQDVPVEDAEIVNG